MVDEYDNLPDDDEIAFVQLERGFREELIKTITQTSNQHPTSLAYLEYINRTIAAARGLTLPILQDQQTPNLDQASGVYPSFGVAVEDCLIQIRIRHARRAKGYSVKLDHATREKIRHYLSQIRAIVDKL